MNYFSKAQRLLTKSEYDLVFKESSKIVSSEFVLLYKQNSVGQARLGLAISKKSVSRACDRNYIKRILRETFRKSELSAIDIIVLAKRNANKMDRKLLFSSLNKTWSKLTTVCKK